MENRSTISDSPDITRAGTPDTIKRLRRTTGVRGPGVSVPMCDETAGSDGPDIVGARPPDSRKRLRQAARNMSPPVTVPMKHAGDTGAICAVGAYCPHVVGAAAQTAFM